MEYDLIRLETVLNELARLSRIHRGEYDVLYFGMEYFSEDGNGENSDNMIPEGVNVLNAAHFHKQLCGMLDEVTKGRAKQHIAWACPRKHAKTAWLSNIYLLHQVVYRRRKYIVLFSETTDVAGDFITWGRYQLKLNEKLRGDFGELLHISPSKNETDNKYEYITSSNTKVEAKGLGTQTRGLRHGSSRPDMFILDDLESEDSTNTPELIEKSKTWFRDSMLPAMAKGGICIYLGTILCYGSLLHYVIEERKDFKSKKFAAINSFAEREDLWRQWADIRKEDEEDSVERAQVFYEENKDAMLGGTEILWPGFWSYLELIEILEDSGAKSFNQEFQNNPTDEERQIFKPEYITYFTDEDLTGKNLSTYAAVDFAMGKESGDYSAIITLARNDDTGVCYVIDTFIRRLHPDKFLKEIVDHTLKYQYETLAVESQQAQEWFADKLTEELQNRGYPAHTRLSKIKQRTRKALRIEALLPDIQSGKIRFKKDQRLLLEMLEMYPMHRHDDGPDALAEAFKVARGGNVVVRNIRKGSRW